MCTSIKELLKKLIEKRFPFWKYQKYMPEITAIPASKIDKSKISKKSATFENIILSIEVKSFMIIFKGFKLSLCSFKNLN